MDITAAHRATGQSAAGDVPGHSHPSPLISSPLTALAAGSLSPHTVVAELPGVLAPFLRALPLY